MFFRVLSPQFVAWTFFASHFCFLELIIIIIIIIIICFFIFQLYYIVHWLRILKYIFISMSKFFFCLCSSDTTHFSPDVFFNAKILIGIFDE